MNIDAYQCLAIEGELNIYTVAQWKKSLDDLIGEGSNLELDLGGVQELDTAGLQLLIMTKKAVTASSRLLRLSNHSHAVLEVFELCAMTAFFGDPILPQPNRLRP